MELACNHFALPGLLGERIFRLGRRRARHRILPIRHASYGNAGLSMLPEAPGARRLSCRPQPDPSRNKLEDISRFYEVNSLSMASSLPGLADDYDDSAWPGKRAISLPPGRLPFRLADGFQWFTPREMETVIECASEGDDYS